MNLKLIFSFVSLHRLVSNQDLVLANLTSVLGLDKLLNKADKITEVIIQELSPYVGE